MKTPADVDVDVVDAVVPAIQAGTAAEDNPTRVVEAAEDAQADVPVAVAAAADVPVAVAAADAAVAAVAAVAAAAETTVTDVEAVGAVAEFPKRSSAAVSL